MHRQVVYGGLRIGLYEPVSSLLGTAVRLQWLLPQLQLPTHASSLVEGMGATADVYCQKIQPYMGALACLW